MQRNVTKFYAGQASALLSDMYVQLKGESVGMKNEPVAPEGVELGIAKLSAIAFTDEHAHIKHLLEELHECSAKHDEIFTNASRYVLSLRKSEKNGQIESFFQQYPLNSKQGLALMTLAEALLRIPDDETANDLIHDTLKDIDWSDHGAPKNSLLADASSKGLQLASGIFGLGKTAQTLTDPIIRRFVKKVMQETGCHFVMGETIKSAVERAKEYEAQGYTMSYDMLGEAARSEKQANDFFHSYLNTIETLGKMATESESLFERPGVSIKLSALHPRYELLKKVDVYERLLPRLKELAMAAMKYNIPLTIDAEEAHRFDLSLEIIADLLRDQDLAGWNGIGLALQAYQKRAYYAIDLIANIAKETRHIIPVRLVKGAYWDSEIKEAQMLGLENYPVFTHKEYTDVSYLACAKKMLSYHDSIYSQFATHNAYSIAAVEAIADGKPFEYQLLHGMGQGLYSHVVGGKAQCRIYAPVGPYKDLLPYLIRRLLENGANNSFIKALSDKNMAVEDFLQNPMELAAAIAEKEDVRIMMPKDIYWPQRKNSGGLDLGCVSHLAELRLSLKKYQDKTWTAGPVIGGWETEGEHRKVFAPYDNKLLVGEVIKATKQHITLAMDTAYDNFEEWSATPANKRALKLERLADLFEANLGELIALCMKEGGKTLEDSIAEIREAADFCRYYAQQARELFSHPASLISPTGESNALSLHGRGVFLCISPWNFPLAIFTGQITAALAAGNTVIAKPADHTMLIAHKCIELMLQAGIPYGVVNLLTARGSEIDELLLDERLAGVAFTGSNNVAKIINKQLAARDGTIIPLIAETGGQNAMIIDSSALLERAVDDVVQSAFGSAGQRCSALRVLYVQDDIADDFNALLKGAMAELRVSSPELFSTDIGPVIDKEAEGKLEVHIVRMHKEGKLIAALEMEEMMREQGSFVMPHAFEIPSINVLNEEMFGPVLHVIRFKLNELDKIIEEINSTGFGLTFGMHSRIQSRFNYVASRIKVGNAYINRNQVGAVVGVQPFGGEGLSGTGPKAGGPHYLLRFANERVRTINTAAIGGDVGLLG